MTALIQFIGVSCFTEDGGAVFENAGLTLSGGENVMLSAPSGSGKGAFLKLVAGLVKPDKGELLIFGEDIAKLSHEALSRARRRIGFVFQDAVLISNLKVIENVALPLLYHTDRPYKECMERALKLLDMAGYRGNVWALPGPLPPYVKKEVAIAKALAMEPDVIICENLSAGLNYDEIKHLSGLLLDYRSTRPKSLLVMTTAVESDAAFIKPDRVVRIENRAFTQQ